MNAQQIATAINLISKSNNVKVSFNVPVTDNYTTIYPIVIHECNAGLIADLVNEGYSLYMRDKGLTVEKL